MKKLLFALPFILSCFLIISCSSDDNDMDDAGNEEIEIPDDFDTNSDDDIDIDNAITIKFNSDKTVEIDNPYSNEVAITTDNGNVTVTSTIASTELNYVLSGQTTDGSLKIYSDYKFGLVMNGISIVSTNGPAINIQSGKKVSITLVDSTNNRLVDGSAYSESDTEDMKAALFSEGQLIFGGEGILQVIGRYKHGICSDDYVRINSGNITISSAVKDGIHTNDYFEMNGGTLNVTSSGDGIECEEGYIVINNGYLTITSKDGDGLKTSYKGDDTGISPYIEIAGGSVVITVNGEAAKAVKSKGDIAISGGDIDLTTTGDAYYDTDDADTSSAAGIKADGNMAISGTPEITIHSSGNGGKGINIEGTLTFNGGITSVTTTGDQYVYDKNNDTAAKAIKSDGNLTINSGTITIRTSKTEAEGLESKATLTINGGTVDIEAYDDCINASNHIEITGGTVYCLSATNDGIDSNGTLTISGGTIVSIGSSSPEEGFDCDNNTFKITGGTLIGVGGATSSPTSSVCTQRSLVYGGSSFSVFHIESSTGEDIVTFKSPKTFSRTTILFSSPSLAANTSYTVFTGGSISGGTNNYGLYTGATYTKGSSAGTFTTSSMVSSLGTNNGGMGGGRP